MGVCRFFQQGSCRFGTKCHNEHFDVKQYLKTDIESCLNGKMWPFSAYGPFKDKPSIPNFIEDQSFEEVRMQAYESQMRGQNYFDEFHKQFNNQVLETTNKMKAMLQNTPQILDIMIQIYETPEDQSQTVQNNNNAINSNNPFAFGGANNNNNGTQAGSIFGKPALGAQNSGNIFGGGAAAPVGSSFGAAPGGNSIFGGAAVAGSGIFGGASNAGIFGQQQQPQQQQQQVFGQQQSNAFGQQQPMAQAQPSIFAQAQPQQQQQNLFGGGNVFGQAVNGTSFGQAFAPQPQQQPAQQQQQGSIFSQAAAAPNAGNIFAQAAQPQQPPSGFFGQAAAAAGFQPQQQQMQSEAPQQQMQSEAPQQQQMQQQQHTISALYSRLEDLTAEEITAYKADHFAVGQLPLSPPPRELC